MAGFREGTGQDPGARRPSGFTLDRFAGSVGFAWAGLRYGFARHPNLRMELGLAIICLGMAWWLLVPAWLILISWCTVICVELLNTALEELIDLVSPEYNELAGRAKDLAAAAVLVAAFATLVVNAVLLVPPLLARFGLVPL